MYWLERYKIKEDILESDSDRLRCIAANTPEDDKEAEDRLDEIAAESETYERMRRTQRGCVFDECKRHPL
jgi:hypothetical protein